MKRAKTTLSTTLTVCDKVENEIGENIKIGGEGNEESKQGS